MFLCFPGWGIKDQISCSPWNHKYLFLLPQNSSTGHMEIKGKARDLVGTIMQEGALISVVAGGVWVTVNLKGCGCSEIRLTI